MNKNNKRSGFTLLELVIIVAILALVVQLATTNHRANLLKASRLEQKMLIYDAHLTAQSCRMYPIGMASCKLPEPEGYIIVRHADGLQLLSKGGNDWQCYDWRMNKQGALTVYAYEGEETTGICV